MPRPHTEPPRSPKATAMPLEVIEVETAAQPSASIIVLHGLGADGNDFVPICDELDLASVGPVRFVFPHAPTRSVTINGGSVMRAWYDIFGPPIVRPSHGDGSPSTGSAEREDEAGLRQSLALVDALITRERERGIAASRIVLAGFSQGCAMTLLTGLRHAERLAGLVALSGYLPLAARTAAERHAAQNGLPIFMAHGRHDGVIAIARAIASRDVLSALGHAVEWHEYPMQHSVCAEEIVDLNRWLLRVLA
jgi:phospholipase/carboxylesterase